MLCGEDEKKGSVKSFMKSRVKVMKDENETGKGNGIEKAIPTTWINFSLQN
jgi:hypothetical protein